MKNHEPFDHPDDTDESDEIRCKYCPALVYWGPHYDAQGNLDRRLFSASSKRLHDCRPKPDAGDFDVVPE
jgi:hypothetical protein